MTASLYQILQVVSVTIFERVPILQALQLQHSQDNSGVFSNQLILLDLWPDSSVRHSPSKTSRLGPTAKAGNQLTEGETVHCESRLKWEAQLPDAGLAE